MIKLETLKQLLETSLNNNNFEKFLRQLDEQPINKENFFDYIKVVEDVIADKSLRETIGVNLDSGKKVLEAFGTIKKEESFFDYLEDFKLNISSIFKRKLSNYEDAELMKTINDKLEDFESRLII